MKNIFIILLCLPAISFSQPGAGGCSDSTACNYDPAAANGGPNTSCVFWDNPSLDLTFIRHNLLSV